MIRKLIKSILRKLDYQIEKLHKQPLNINEPFLSIKLLMAAQERKGVFFDIGANTGQTILEFKEYFPQGKIFAFEPGKAFKVLSEKFKNHTNIKLENFAFGSKQETKIFYENNRSDMSSFFTLGKKGWGEVVEKVEVNINTIDAYCKQNKISRINLLKCDTQGFELEILNGAKEKLKDIQFIFLEVNFEEIYENLPDFFDIFNFLSSHNFKLVKFYRQRFINKENTLLSTDVLFSNASFNSDFLIIDLRNNSYLQQK